MPRVIGIDPGTVSVDLCGLEDGRVILDRSIATRDALSDPDAFVAALCAAGPLDLVAGPSGYGLPLIRARDATDEDLRLAFLAAPGPVGEGGIGGLRRLASVLAQSDLPVVFTPGVIHLPTVPAHRKVNRIDMGTADKVAATALAIATASPGDASFVLLELGGGFTAGVAVADGRIVDGVGGSSGPLGFRAAGAWDAEVVLLAGQITKRTVFGGGAVAVAGWSDDVAPDRLGVPANPREELALAAYVEQAAKAAVQLSLAIGKTEGFVLSGRLARVAAIRDRLEARLAPFGPTRLLAGFAGSAKQGAQGAAVMADGLAGGTHRALVDRLELRNARGTVFDHLHVISPAAARRQLGLS